MIYKLWKMLQFVRYWLVQLQCAVKKKRKNEENVGKYGHVSQSHENQDTKLRISLSCFCHQMSVSNKGKVVSFFILKIPPIKRTRSYISILPLCFFRRFFDRRLFAFQSSVAAKIIEIKIGLNSSLLTSKNMRKCKVRWSRSKYNSEIITKCPMRTITQLRGWLLVSEVKLTSM